MWNTIRKRRKACKSWLEKLIPHEKQLSVYTETAITFARTPNISKLWRKLNCWEVWKFYMKQWNAGNGSKSPNLRNEIRGSCDSARKMSAILEIWKQYRLTLLTKSFEWVQDFLGSSVKLQTIVRKFQKSACEMQLPEEKAKFQKWCVKCIVNAS